MSSTSRAHRPLRILPFAAALVLLLLGGAFTTATARARETGPAAQMVSLGGRPTTETMRQMVARDARYRAVERMTRLPRLPEAPAPARPSAGEATGRQDEPQLPAPQVVGTGFEGVDASQAGGVNTTPTPDSTGAMGPDHYVEIVNDRVVIYSRAGAQLSSVTGSNFFNKDQGGIILPRGGIDYLRVLYDQRSGRWFACGVERSNGEFNHCLLAVSRTSDAMGVWDKYLMAIGQGRDSNNFFHTVWSTLGLDDNGVYVGALVERQSIATGNTLELIPVLMCAVKANLIAAPPTLGTTFRFTLGSQNRWGPPQVPHNLGSVGPQAPAYVINSPAITQNQIIFSTLTWNAGTPALSGASSVATGSYGLVPGGASQGSGAILVLGDDRLQASMIRNGRLWTCRTVGVNNAGGGTQVDRAGCEWLELQTAPAGTLSLVQSGRVYTPQADPRAYFQPSIAVNGQGHMALGFHAARGGERISLYTCGRLAGDPAGTIGAPTLIRNGTADWLYSQGATSPWGRSTQTCVDPADDQTLWTLGNYVKDQGGSGIWGSQISPLLAPAPTLPDYNVIALAGAAGVTFQLSGTGFFDPGPGFARRPSVAISGNGVSNVSVTVESPTSATVTLDLAAGASPGFRDLTFTNPDGQSYTAMSYLRVAPRSVLKLTQAVYLCSETPGGSHQAALGITGFSGLPAIPSTTAQVTITGGSATAGDDFDSSFSNIPKVLIGTGITFPLTPEVDFLLEGDETIELTLSVQNADLGSPSTATVTIQDDLDNLKPTNLSTMVTGGQVALQWTDNCDNEDGYRVEVSSDGGATFQTAGTTGSNATSTSVSGITGGNRLFRVRAFRGSVLSNPTVAAFLQLASLQLSAASFSGSEVSGLVPVTVTRTGLLSQAYTLRLSTSNGTATAPGDYTAQTNTTVSFAANETSRTVNIPVSADQLLEGDETLSLTLTNPTGTNAVFGAQTAASATITDDPAPCTPTNLTATQTGAGTIRLDWTDHCANEDSFVVERSTGVGFTVVASAGANATMATDSTAPADTALTYRVRAVKGAVSSNNSATATIQSLPTLGFSVAAYTGSEASGMVQVTLSRSSAASAASVTLSSSDGTAVAAADYTAQAGTVVNLGSGELTKTVNVPVSPDTLLEGDETFTLTLANPTGAVLGAQTTATATIMDDPAPCTPTGLTAVQVSPGTIRLDWTDHCANEDSFVVERSTGGGFTTLVTVGPNTTMATDSPVSVGATLTYRVRAVKGVLRSDNSATATVQALPTLAFSAGTYGGSEAGGTVQVIITRDSSAGTASVTVSTSNGTAAAPADYTALSGTMVNFGAGEVVKTVDVTVNADQSLEGDETFTLTLSSPTGAVLGPQSTATATITDNAAPVAPTNLAALPVGPATVRLSWTDHCSNESGFQLERSSGGGAFSVIGTAPANATITQDATATAGTAYTYRLRAVQGSLQSGASNEAQVTIPAGGVAKITPTRLSFKTVKLGKTKTLKVTIQNTSKTGSLAGFLSLNGAAGYTLVGGDRPFALAPKQKLVVNLTFAPGAAGAASGTLTVLTTATNLPSLNVPLTGTGK